MNRVERMYRIHEMLRDGGVVPMRRFMEELECSLATVKRDLTYLRDFMGAPIVYDNERRGYRYDPKAPAFELPGLWFNPSELYALLACEQLLEQVQPGLLSPLLRPLRRRIRELLAHSGHDPREVTDRIRLLGVGLRQPDPRIFARVASAVLAGRVLTITYHSRSRDERQERRVHPQRLLHYRGNWYLLAWCEKAQGLRLFALERIEAAHEERATAHRLLATELDAYVESGFGIFTGPPKARAVLVFTPERARWVSEERWHPQQRGEWLPDGRFRLEVPYADPTELVMEILKYGPDVEVLAPDSLRRLVVERLERALGRYHLHSETA